MKFDMSLEILRHVVCINHQRLSLCCLSVMFNGVWATKFLLNTPTSYMSRMTLKYYYWLVFLKEGIIDFRPTFSRETSVKSGFCSGNFHSKPPMKDADDVTSRRRVSGLFTVALSNTVMFIISDSLWADKTHICLKNI